MFNYFLKDRSLNQSYFEILGQDQINSLVDNFYEIMESDPKAKECFELHEIFDGRVHTESKEKLKAFLTGWMGGPNLFVERYGPPRMRARHLHIRIDEQAKEQWLYCMEKSMKKTNLYKKEKKKLMNSFLALAMRIRNA